MPYAYVKYDRAIIQRLAKNRDTPIRCELCIDAHPTKKAAISTRALISPRIQTLS